MIQQDFPRLFFAPFSLYNYLICGDPAASHTGPIFPLQRETTHFPIGSIQPHLDALPL